MGVKRVAGNFVVIALGLGIGAHVAWGADAEAGKKLFKEKNCISCHSLGDQKGPMAKLGGPLDGVGGKRDAAWLKGYLSDPKSKMPEAKMPKLKYSDQDLDALVQYMLTLK